MSLSAGGADAEEKLVLFSGYHTTKIKKKKKAEKGSAADEMS
jgi:hypothetical protein